MSRLSSGLDPTLQDYILRNSPPEHSELARRRAITNDICSMRQPDAALRLGLHNNPACLAKFLDMRRTPL